MRYFSSGCLILILLLTIGCNSSLKEVNFNTYNAQHSLARCCGDVVITVSMDQDKTLTIENIIRTVNNIETIVKDSSDDIPKEELVKKLSDSIENKTLKNNIDNYVFSAIVKDAQTKFLKELFLEMCKGIILAANEYNYNKEIKEIKNDKE